MATRRNFLRIAGLAAAAGLVGPQFDAAMVSAGWTQSIFPSGPVNRLVLVGDGVADDTAAMQCLFNGGEVVYGGRLIGPSSGSVVVVPQGHFRILRPASIPADTHIDLRHGLLGLEGGERFDAAIRFTGTKSSLRNANVDCGGARVGIFVERVQPVRLYGNIGLGPDRIVYPGEA